MKKNSIQVLDEHFAQFELGCFSPAVGPQTEYHFLPEAMPRKGWSVACFATGLGADSAWDIQDTGNGKAMVQTHHNEHQHTHPMVITGDFLWTDYMATTTFQPKHHSRSGMMFRYHNNRCYYFVGFEKDAIKVLVVNHEKDFLVPNEIELANYPIAFDPTVSYTMSVTVHGPSIFVEVKDVVSFHLEDDTFLSGKVGFLADDETIYSSVSVSMDEEAYKTFLSQKQLEKEQIAKVTERLPEMKFWKKIDTAGFGTGRNIRFGDVDNDGEIEIIIGQVKVHGPHDAYSEVGCITVVKLDGSLVWQSGTPDKDAHKLTNDVAFQVHDIDGDGHLEVVYARDQMLVIADGMTGEIKKSVPTPISKPDGQKFERILGDALYFADFRGLGRAADIVIKDRYWNFWVYDDSLNPLWEGTCNTGHYPYAADIDGDGKDELLMGYSLYDDDGSLLWSLDDTLEQHADGVTVVAMDDNPSTEPVIIYAASDEGFLFVSLDGKIFVHHRIGHAQNPTVAKFRADLPGLQAVSINFWGNQGLMHFYDSKGAILSDAEPINIGSICEPVNWTGENSELFIHSANVEYGGLYDGFGRQVLQFPDDGHPEMSCAVLDVTGDCRDELLVWDPNSIWIYTQADSPLSGRVYNPIRNPLYNRSNYQVNISLPRWNEGFEKEV